MNKVPIKGFLDKVTSTRISGWAMSTDIPKEPLEVSLFIDGIKVMNLKAEKFRKGLKDNGVHPTGNCGYVFKIPKDKIIQKKCKVEVKAGKDQIDVSNSPWFFNPVEEKSDTLKVLIVGLAKSGTSILTYRVADGMKDHKLFFEPKGSKGLTDVFIHQKITSSPRIITKVLYQSKEQNNLAKIEKLYNKKIWIVRDPRDHLISTFFYRWRHEGQYDKKDFENCLNLVKQKENNPSKIPFMKLLEAAKYNLDVFTKQYYSVSKIINKLGKDWLVLHYEDFIDNKVDDLNTFLGFNVNTKASVDPKITRVERSKAYGNWRRWFTEDDVKLLKPLFDDKLVLLNYDEKDWNLEKTTSLPKSEGSSYMKKLIS